VPTAASGQDIQDAVEQSAGVASRSADVRLRWREVFLDNYPEIIVNFPEYHDPVFYLKGLIISGQPQYHGKVMKLRERCSQISKMAPSLLEAEDRRRKEENAREEKEDHKRKVDFWRYAAIGLIFTTIGSAIGFALGVFFLQ
jgi:hypothetical protein